MPSPEVKLSALRVHSTECCFQLGDKQCREPPGEWCLLVLEPVEVHLRCNSCYQKELGDRDKMKSVAYHLVKRKDAADWVRLRRLA